MNQYAMNETVQRRLEVVSEAEYDTHAPPYKRRKLSRDSTVQSYTRTNYENNHTHGNARAHYGDVYNNYMGQAQPPLLPPIPSSISQDSQSNTLDAARWIQALRFDHMDSRFTTISSAHPGTCEWLFEREEYKAWRNPDGSGTHRGFLCIKGKPATGKSTLMRSAYLHGMNTFSEHAIVSYFFGLESSEAPSHAEGLYRSFLCQLLDKLPELSAALQKHTPCLGSMGQGHVVWPEERLKALLREAVLALRSRRLTCYVDAIDECGYSEAQDIVDFLQELGVTTNSAGTHVCVLLSRRHYPNLAVEGCQQIVLEDQIEHQKSIALYMQSRLRLGVSSQAQKINSVLQERACGVFLWVVLIVRILNEEKLCGRVHMLERRLQELPDDLDHLFGRILQGKGCDDRTLLLTFQWLLFAHRPLRVEERYFGIVTSDSNEAIEAWDRDNVSTTDMENFILSSSKGLVEISKSKEPIVQFIHGSVRDYLLSKRLSLLHGTTQPATLAALCHDRLKQCCHQHVLKCEEAVLSSTTDGVRESMTLCFRKTNELRARMNRLYPFLDYALYGMVSHANSSHLLGLQQHNFVRQFPVQLWVRLHNLLVNNPKDRLSLTVTREYILVINNATGLVGSTATLGSTLTDEACDKPKEKFHSLLGAAVAKGFDAMSELLLERGSDPNSLVRNGIRCLDVSVMQGNTSLVRMLLAHKACVQPNTSCNQNLHLCPLRMAAELGLADIVGLLLLHPDYAHRWHPDMDHVLEAAIYRRDSAILQLLHGRMNLERRSIVEVIHGRRNLVEVGQTSNALEVLHLFRIYYRARNRSQPAVFEAFCAVFRGCLAEPFRNLESSHAVQIPYQLGHDQAESNVFLSWVAQALAPLFDEAAVEGGQSRRYTGAVAASAMTLHILSVVQHFKLPALLTSTSSRTLGFPVFQRRLQNFLTHGASLLRPWKLALYALDMFKAHQNQDNNV